MNMEGLIAKIEKELPDVCYPKDLERIPLFGHRSTYCYKRLKGEGPKYLHIGPKKIVYLKADIIEWLKSRYVDSKRPTNG